MLKESHHFILTVRTLRKRFSQWITMLIVTAAGYNSALHDVWCIIGVPGQLHRGAPVSVHRNVRKHNSLNKPCFYSNLFTMHYLAIIRSSTVHLQRKIFHLLQFIKWSKYIWSQPSSLYLSFNSLESIKFSLTVEVGVWHRRNPFCFCIFHDNDIISTSNNLSLSNPWSFSLIQQLDI